MLVECASFDGIHRKGSVGFESRCMIVFCSGEGESKHTHIQMRIKGIGLARLRIGQACKTFAVSKKELKVETCAICLIDTQGIKALIGRSQEGLSCCCGALLLNKNNLECSFQACMVEYG